MTPIKVEDFLAATAPEKGPQDRVNLNELGLYHAAPRENGVPLLALRFDADSGTLMPAA